ncbi:uncharacterized protein LOC121716079 isoform X3 [Alosa sapidissima]|uniref:uncharacterized protein LOC121716079 isoform X3 n=1 Tax=Alosa sapidissima TaxID=34773 RepID=UPI001C084BF6|nr:uncharacterized protein LOC121716079 isoform X3 [Alosa sapidissima]
MAVMAKVVVLVLIASFSNVFCLPKRDVVVVNIEVDVSTTPCPNNQTQTEAEGEGVASEDFQAGTPAPNANNRTATAQPDVTDGASEDDVVTSTPSPQNQTTPAVQTGDADGPSEDAEVAVTTQNAQNQTTSTHTVGTDGVSEDHVLTSVLNLQNGTTSAQDGITITDSCSDPSEC